MVGRARTIARSRRRARWGNLRRPYPFSERYGFDRGLPIDRHYLHSFFAARGVDITGAVLEVKDPAFSERYGHGITRLDLVDIDADNTRATVIADLAEPGSLPAAVYDCVVIPQTLQYVDDPAAALANAWQSLRPGGVLLVTVPTVARLDPELRPVDRWRFTPAGLASLVERACPGGAVEVDAYGGLVASLAFLLGLSAGELRHAELDDADDAWPVVTCARVRRPGALT